MSLCKSFSVRLFLLCTFMVLAGAILFLKPELDLNTAEAFFTGGVFPWRSQALPNFFHDLVHPVSLSLAFIFMVMIGYCLAKKKSSKPALFMLLTLIIGPGLITNTLLKDNWGRARPVQVTEFGGKDDFGPPLLIDDECNDNCSFVGGDAAFGYWFHSFAYVAKRRRRMVFIAGVGVGLGYSLLRVGMGAHFLSDVFFAAVVVLLSSATIHAAVFGKAQLKARWREFLGGE